MQHNPPANPLHSGSIVEINKSWFEDEMNELDRRIGRLKILAAY